MFLASMNNTIMKGVNCLIVLSMCFLTTCIGLQILNRFVMKIPMPWTEEYACYAFVWLAMFGSAKAVREKSHIFVDFLEVVLKGMTAKVCGIIADAVSMVFFATLLYVSIPWTVKNLSVGTESIPAITIGMWFMCIPISAALMILFGIEVFISRFSSADAREGGS